jgi:predicted glycosyltransferase
MDEPTVLVDEWERKCVFPALEELYDAIWVYGLPEIFDPLREIPGMSAFSAKTHFTGYLRRTVGNRAALPSEHGLPTEPSILVTPGGGGDGAELIEWVIAAYEHDPALPHPALIVFGPFLPPEIRQAFQERVARHPRLCAITFDPHVEPLFERAVGVVAMGGYNTFCEILSFGKPALLVPRTLPRLEQHLRAERAQRLGLIRMLANDGARSPERMARCLHELPGMAVPGEAARAAMLQGLDEIGRLVEPWLNPRAEVHELRRSRYA